MKKTTPMILAAMTTLLFTGTANAGYWMVRGSNVNISEYTDYTLVSGVPLRVRNNASDRDYLGCTRTIFRTTDGGFYEYLMCSAKRESMSMPMGCPMRSCGTPC